jgi:hypothetical protein
MAKAKEKTDDELLAEMEAEEAAAKAGSAKPEWRGVIAELAGKNGELHAIQVRFAEMVPFLPGAIEKAEGELKDFLTSLAKHL